MALRVGPRSGAPLLAALVLAVCLFAAVFAALSVGRFPVGPLEVVRLFWSGLAGTPSALSDTAATVFWQIRVPRVLCALLVGAALAAAGASLQSVFRNPLAAPDLLGVSAGAALGAVVGIFLGWGPLAVQLTAFAGGLGAVAVVMLVSRWLPIHDRSLGLVLSGIAVGSMLGALVALVKTLADPYRQLPAITFWLMGSFSSVTPDDLRMLALGLALSVAPLILMRWRADALVLSDDEIRSIGIDAPRLRLLLIACATLAAALTVATAGIIGWIGLVVPHAARLLVGARFSRLLPVAMLIGGLLMLIIDTLARSLAAIEVPPGVLTALIGGPVLFALMARGGRR